MRRKKIIENPVFDEKELREELFRSAKAIGISVAVAEAVSLKIAKGVANRVAKRAAITADDLNRFIAMEAEKYSKDLSYVYKNRGKII